jgi:prevent-host-death family protein
MIEDDPNRKGNAAELAIAAEAARLGLEVWHPLTEHGRCDLVLGIAGRLYRVQCKWARRSGEVVQISLETSRRTRDGYVRTRYTDDEVDAIAAYCDELDACYLIPIELAARKSAISLRLSPTRNGQRAALNWAEHYRLGAVAQLAERRRGTAEARGSNPLSSTSHVDSTPSTEEVGAHEFRNHFGYYLDRASAGTEVLVSRRNQPYARLCPPTRPRRLPLCRPAKVANSDVPKDA